MGAKSIMEPTTEPWGQRTCYVADPEGNLIEISSFKEQGTLASALNCEEFNWHFPMHIFPEKETNSLNQ